MALASAYTVALTRAAGHVIEARADLADGLAGMTLAGLPDTARDRIRAAIINSGQPWPQRNQIPWVVFPSLPRYSSAFDTAVAVLAAAGAVPADPLLRIVIRAELGLDGRLRPVPGVQPAVTAAREAGFGAVVVAADDAAGAALIPGIRVIPRRTSRSWRPGCESTLGSEKWRVS